MEASFSGANQFIPAPNSSLETLISNFELQGLDVGDLVALSGKINLEDENSLQWQRMIFLLFICINSAYVGTNVKIFV